MKGSGKKRRWRWFYLMIIIPLAAGGAYLYVNSENGKASAGPTEFTLHTVASVASSSTVEVSGNIEPIHEEDLGFLSSGEVVGVYVEEGDYVKAETLVAELDDSDQVHALAVLDNTIMKTKISGSKGDLELLQLERESKLSEMRKRKLYTPISGYVSEVDITVGELVKSENQIDAVVRVIDRSSMTAEVEIDELDVPLVRVGQPVKFVFDALPDTEITGMVSFLPVEARVTNEGIAVLDAHLIIEDPPDALIPGFSFTAEVGVGDEENLLVLEAEAVMERNGKRIVLLYTDTGGGPVPREIKTVPYEEGKVQVLSGLEEGDTVASVKAPAEGSVKAGEKDSKSPIEMLGLPQRPGGGGGPPKRRGGGPPQGGGRP